jgi:hypothetical protein
VPWRWEKTPISGVHLDAAGLVALADLSTIAQRTALSGTSSWLDVFAICPGIHKQQDATELNQSEYPTTAAMTTGYVFRVENQATAFYLQQIGKSGHLITLEVTSPDPPVSSMKGYFQRALPNSLLGMLTGGLYISIIILTILAISLMVAIKEFWGVAILFMLMFARLLNVVVIRRRVQRGAEWKGAAEPGVKGDLLILVSQDRWVRMRGLVDDIKAVTSGTWLDDMSMIEGPMVSIATLLVYLSAALAANTNQIGSIIILIVLLLNVALLALANDFSKTSEGLTLYGRRVHKDPKKPPQKFNRRLDLAEMLIKQTGRKDWAIRLGLINGDWTGDAREAKEDSEKTPEKSEVKLTDSIEGLRV